METVEQLISDEQIEAVWDNFNFGATSRREIIRQTLLKQVCGFSSGRTAMFLVRELGLVYGDSTNLTPYGKRYLWAAYSGGVSV